MNDDFEKIMSESLHSRAAEMSRPVRGMHDVRRRVQRRRHRRRAATMLPVLAGVSYLGVRAAPESERPSDSVLAPDRTPGTSLLAPTSTADGVVSTSAAASQNFLIVGSDANACVDPSSPWAGAADPIRDGRDGRSDTIIVLRLEPATNSAAMLSFPRDLWVDIAGRGKGRMNSAFVEGDPFVLTQTIYDNFGIVVDHYLQIDLCAFKRIVDALGGVAVPFSTRVVDRSVGLDIAPGCHTFTGDEALAYVRSRHLVAIDDQGEQYADGSSDLGRISRQQDFIRRTLGAALTRGLFDPSVASALLQSLPTDIVTEAGFTVDDMLSFATVLRGVDPATMGSYQIEVTDMMVSGNSVLQAQLDSEAMQSVLATFRGQTSAGAVVPSEGDTASVTPNVDGDIVPDPSVLCS